MGFLAYILLVACLVMIGIEFVWLSILAARNEAAEERAKGAGRILREKIDSIVSAPTFASMDEGVRELKEFTGQDKSRMNAMCELLMERIAANGSAKTEGFRRAVYLIIRETGAIGFYAGMLGHGNAYDKAYACRKMADFGVVTAAGSIRGLLYSGNRNLYYNAAAALSALGDEEGVFRAISGIRSNFRLSYRVIVEILDQYTGDIAELGKRLLAIDNEYIRASVVKALAKRRIAAFEDLYLRMLGEKNANLRAAALRALGELGMPGSEQAFIAASRDAEWTVRLAAVRAMRRLRTPEALSAVAAATGDAEWWVRYNAAQALAEMDSSLVYVEKVLKGYDPYASEAVLRALYEKSCAAEG